MTNDVTANVTNDATANVTNDATATVDRTASSTAGVVDGGSGPLTRIVENVTVDGADATQTTVVDGTTAVVRRTTDAVTATVDRAVDRTVDRTVATTGIVEDVVDETVAAGPLVGGEDPVDRESSSLSTEPTPGAAPASEPPAVGAATAASAADGGDANESAAGAGDDESADETGADEATDGGSPVQIPGVDPAGSGPALGALVVAGSLVATRSGMAASTMGAGAATLPRALFAVVREFGVRLAVLAGYSRYDFSDPLENDNRATVLEAVESSPGINLTSLVGATDLAESTVRYHLRVLEHEDLLEAAKVRGRRRYVPRTDDDVELVAAFEEDATKDVLAALFEHEPATGTALAEALDRDPSTVSHHLSRLSEAGLVDREQDGPALRNSLSPKVRRAFSEVEVTSSVQGHARADD